MAKETPFCPCEVCWHLRDSKPNHVLREARRVVTFNDDDGELAGMALCTEHWHDYRRARPIGADVEEPHVTH